MPDQPENPLLTFYADTIAKAKSFLQSRCAVEELQDGVDYEHVRKLNSGARVWRITAQGKARGFTFCVAIPPTFPDCLPQFYLSEQDFISIGKMPHIDMNRFICTRDTAVVVANDDKPGEAIEELLQIAIGTIESGIQGESHADFESEFLAYWNDGAIEKAILVCAPPETPVVLAKYSLPSKLYGSSYLVATSDQYAASWLEKLGVSQSLHRIGAIQCIQLLKVPDAIPSTNGDLILMLQDCDDKSHAALQNFTGDTVLVHIMRGNATLAFLWQHTIRDVNGFRRGMVPIPLVLKRSKSDPIVRLKLVRLDQDRLVRRAVDMGITIGNNVPLALIGCGSIGSTLAMLLAKSGVSDFILVDPDKLTEENVARHLCGCNVAATYMKKVDAVKQALGRHLPFVTCDTYDEDVRNLLRNNPDVFELARLMIFATADIGVERRANDFFRLHNPKPVVYLWLEPYAVAGHLLYVSPQNGACFRCCMDEEGFFRFAVAEKGQNLLCRESGCQSTFTPYGAVELEIFCGLACKEILKILVHPPDHSMLVTWIGDKEQFQSGGYRISDEYAAHESYSLHRRRLNRHPECGICRMQ